MGCQQSFKAETPIVVPIACKDRPRGFLTTFLSRLDELTPEFKQAAITAEVSEITGGIEAMK